MKCDCVRVEGAAFVDVSFWRDEIGTVRVGDGMDDITGIEIGDIGGEVGGGGDNCGGGGGIKGGGISKISTTLESPRKPTPPPKNILFVDVVDASVERP
jgi:hypothetical protein